MTASSSESSAAHLPPPARESERVREMFGADDRDSDARSDSDS